MINHYKILTLLLLISFSFFLSFNIVLAQVKVNLQVPIYGQSTVSSSDPNNPAGLLSAYISLIYTYALGIASTLAVVMIMVGGFIWLTSAGSPDRVGLAKDFIASAITGLIIALFSYIILQTINPNLVTNTAPQISSPTDISSGQTGTATGQPVASSVSDQEIRQALFAAGIGVKDPCPPGVATNCVDLDGLPMTIVDDLTELQAACGCNPYISGGTEDGHSSHGSGKKIVDLRISDPALNSYVYNTGTQTNAGFGSVAYCIDNDLYVNEGDHWHVEYDTSRSAC